MKKILFFTLISFNLKAQTEVKISGWVFSDLGKKLNQVHLSFKQEKQTFKTATDSLGYFFIAIPQGEATIKITKPEYETQHFLIDAKKDTELHFTLKDDKKNLNEVVVFTPTKKGVNTLTNGEINFNPQRLSTIPSITGVPDIIKLLQLTPGVQNSGDANGYLYVRGGDPGHNLMLYADTPIYGMAHLLGVFPFYNSGHIENVHFDKSNLDAKNGGRLSALVDIMPYTKPPKKIGVDASLGLLASQATFAVPITKNTGLYISGRKTYVDAIVSTLLNNTQRNVDAEVKTANYDFKDGNLSFISDFSKKHNFSIDAFLSSDKLILTESTFNFKSNLKWKNKVITPSWRWQLNENLKLTTNIFYSEYGNDLTIFQVNSNIQVNSSLINKGFKSTLDFKYKKIPITAGLQFDDYKVQPQKTLITNENTNSFNKEASQINTNASAIFINSKPKFNEKWTAELGLRLNYYNQETKNNSYLHLEPRALLMYSLKKNYSFFASYTLQNQYLNLITTSSVGVPTDFWVASSEGIPSQSSNEYVLGGTKEINNSYNFSLNGFYRKMNHLLEYPFGLMEFNQTTDLKNDFLEGKGRAYGFETIIKDDFGKLKGWISYTLSWSERRFDKLNYGNWFYGQYDRRHNLCIVTTYDLSKKINFGFTQLFSTGSRFTAPSSWYLINNNPVKEYGGYNNAQLPNYIRTDVSVNYSFIKTAQKESTLVVSIYNTFNRINPLYISLRIDKNNENGNLVVKLDKKWLYTILPSLSWRFKF